MNKNAETDKTIVERFDLKHLNKKDIEKQSPLKYCFSIDILLFKHKNYIFYRKTL